MKLLQIALLGLICCSAACQEPGAPDDNSVEELEEEGIIIFTIGQQEAEEDAEEGQKEAWIAYDALEYEIEDLICLSAVDESLVDQEKLEGWVKDLAKYKVELDKLDRELRSAFSASDYDWVAAGYWLQYYLISGTHADIKEE